MKTFLNIAALIVSFLALGMCFNQSGYKVATSTKQETSYERVIRTRTLRCGYALWPKLEDIDANTGKLTGLAPDFANALAEKLNLRIEWIEEVQWGEQAEALKTGKIDAICSGDGPWVYTSDTVLDFTEPMVYAAVYLYGRKGETRFRDSASINKPDVTFSSMDGDISMTLAAEKYPQAHRLEIPSSGNPSLVTMNVLTGKADLLIEDVATSDRANGPHGEKLERLSDIPYALINTSFSVGKGQTDLLNMLNQGFQLLQQLGISDAIIDKYDPDHRYYYRPLRRWSKEATTKE